MGWLRKLFGLDDGAKPPPAKEISEGQEGALPPVVQQSGMEPDYTGWGDGMDTGEGPFHRGLDGRINTRR